MVDAHALGACGLSRAGSTPLFPHHFSLASADTGADDFRGFEFVKLGKDMQWELSGLHPGGSRDTLGS